MTDILIYIFLLSGSFFILVAAIGLVRLKDLYSRLHAATKAPSFGIFLIVVAAAIYFNLPVVYLKGLFIILFIYLTAPLGAHAIIKSFKDTEDERKFREKE